MKMEISKLAKEVFNKLETEGYEIDYLKIVDDLDVEVAEQNYPEMLRKMNLTDEEYDKKMEELINECMFYAEDVNTEEELVELITNSYRQELEYQK